jgi:hypothetical protein
VSPITARIGLRRLAAAIVAVAGAVALLAATQWAFAAPAGPAGSRGAAATGSAASGACAVTFVNEISQTIWLAASPDPAHPLRATAAETLGRKCSADLSSP